MASSSEAKAALVSYLRFARQMPYVCTEVYITASAMADVAASNGKILVEYEVKTSYADFKADFKKEKHYYYVEHPVKWEGNTFIRGDLKWEIKESENYRGIKGIYIVDPATGDHSPSYSFKTEEAAKEYLIKNYSQKENTPNQFYYVMPKDMWLAHKEKIEPQLKGHYGVITFSNSSYVNMEVEVLAKKLHNRPVTASKLLTMVKRMSSELAGLYKSHYDWINDFSKFRELTKEEFNLNDSQDEKSE